jgi:hypothetical protein
MKALATLTTAAVILSAVVGVAMAPNQDSLQAERIFAAIDRLVEQRAGAPAELEQLARTKLVPVPELSNQFFAVYRGDFQPPSPFKQLEVRRSKEQNPDRGVIILEISDSICVSSNAVRARFGTEPGLAPPLSRQPPGSPVYYVYDKPWGKLSLAISRGTPECLRRAVIDWHS